MVIRACAGVNIVLEGVPMQGIWISSEAGSWYEGPIPHDILVKGINGEFPCLLMRKIPTEILCLSCEI